MIKSLRAFIAPLGRNPAIKFAGVGGLCALLQMIALTLLVENGLMDKVRASAFTYVLGAVINYLLNYYLTFASTQKHSETLPKFILVVAIGTGVNTAVFAVADKLLPWYLLSQVIATGTSTVVNFILHKLWIYRQPR